MKSLERRFKIMAEKNPSAGSYIVFAKTVKGQNFSRPILRKWFYKLVNKEDYARNEVKSLLKHLEDLTNSREERAKLG